jgi:hypothetical protein
MSGAASKAVPQTVRFAFLPAAIGTPQGLPFSSCGQGHAFVAAAQGSHLKPSYRPRRGRTVRPLQGRNDLLMYRDRRFHLRLLTVFPLRRTGQRSNLSESHWSNQWLTLESKVMVVDSRKSPDYTDCLVDLRYKNLRSRKSQREKESRSTTGPSLRLNPHRPRGEIAWQNNGPVLPAL